MALSALPLLLLLAVQVAGKQTEYQGFIRLSGGHFVDDNCQEFSQTGWNGWNLLHHSLNNPSYLTNKFQLARESELNVMRFFVADDDNGPVLQTAPGVFDERVAKGLDLIFAEAGKYGIKLTPVLLNLWKKNNGVPTFEAWCGTSSGSYKPRPDIDLRGESVLSPSERLQTPYNWFTSPKCRQQVKDYITTLLNRRNSITGLLYKDDPTVLSWNLLNEPRCKYCGPEAVNSWFGEMADHVKSMDPNHLVTTGEEGFFEEKDPMASYNPQDGTLWASRSGQDFRANHAHQSIDYAVIHLWPDNWRSPPYDTNWGKQWIESHAKVAEELGKPLVLEEFGKVASEGEITSVRDPWFRMVHDAVDSSIASNGSLKGALFWQWDGESGPRPGQTNDIRASDTTYTSHIKPFAHKMAEGAQDPVPGCSPRSSGTGSSQGQVQAQVQGFSGSTSSAGRKLLKQ